MSNSVHSSIRYIGKGETFAFAFAGGGQNFCYALITNYIMYYYINVFHIDPAIVGFMLLMEGFWDFINNPLAGVIIDRTRTKRGKMIPYLRWFMLPLSLSTILLFSGSMFLSSPSAAAPSKIIYMFVTYVIWEICYTFTDVAYWGLSSALSPNPDDRTRVLTTTNIMINIMAAIPQILVPVLLDYTSLSNTSGIPLSYVFFALGIFGGTVCVGLFSLSGFVVKERIAQSAERPGFRSSLAQIIRNPALRVILASNLLYAFSGVGMVFATYYFIDVLGYASLSILAQVPVAIFSLISYAIVSPVKKRFNNKQIMILTFLLLGGVQLVIYFIGIPFYYNTRIMIPIIMIYQTVLGICSPFLGVIPTEMMAEATDYAEWTTGIRNEGVSFSMKITTTKIEGSLSQSIGAMLLSAIGYITSSESARIAQPEAVQLRLWTMYYLVPGILTLLCAIPYFFYDLIGEKRERMYLELEERRKQNKTGHGDAVTIAKES